MKLKKIAYLALCCALVFLAGCSGNKKAKEEAVVTEAPTETPTPEPTADPTASPEPEPTVSPEPAEVLPEGMVRSYLTGEPVAEEIGRRRPAAVMINNIEACLPHWGISHAGVFYEAPVEGGISRIMAIFEDYDQVERIGSVRSCRNYFIFYASGFEAVYVHYGQSAYAVPYLDLPEVNNLSGLSGYGDQIFYRTSDRNPPHNAYISGQGIREGISICGYSDSYSEDYDGYYQFASAGEPELLEEGRTANTVVPGGFTYNDPVFTYNPETGLYYRSQFGEAHIDEETGEQLAVKNILIQNSRWDYYDSNGYLNIDPDSGGSGVYITNGKAIDVTWKKYEPWGQTYYYDSQGSEITLNEGKTWVFIVLDSYAQDTQIS